ncbi:MAG: PAS domain S-box protein [Alphaproteobacteria bacterium]|nr:PAS domain S-box protein [Alphaproteobacteria bacterium]
MPKTSGQILSDYFIQITDTFFCSIKNNLIDQMNQATCQLLGYAPEELQGRLALKIVAEPDKERVADMLLQRSRTPYQLIRLQTKKGEIIAMNMRAIPLFVNKEQVVLLEAYNETALLQSQRKCAALEKEKQMLAPFDAATGLPSTILLADRSEQALLRALREARGHVSEVNEHVVLMYAVVQNADAIVEKHGQAGWQEVRSVLISRLQNAIRSVDTLAMAREPNAFWLLYERVHTADNVYIILDRLKGAYALPIPYKKAKVRIKLQIGWAIYPDHGTTVPALLKWAKVNNIS